MTRMSQIQLWENALELLGTADASTLLGIALSLSSLDFARDDPEPVEGSQGD